MMYMMTKPIIDMALADKFPAPRKAISKQKYSSGSGRSTTSQSTAESLCEIIEEINSFNTFRFMTKEKVYKARSSPLDA